MSKKNLKAWGRMRPVAVAIQSAFFQSAVTLSLVSATALAHAQNDGTAGVGQSADSEGILLEEVVITGYRNALRTAAVVKHEAVHVADTVFAEDVGKFPDLNVAEAIQRVAGVQLTREIDGSGLQAGVRGLNPNFTKVMLNGAQIAVASSGRTDSASSNREVDLDLFPTEFLTRLDVHKTSLVSAVEGGIGGTVNLRTMRPLDTTTNHINYQVQAGYGEHAEKLSPRASVFGSWKNSDRSFGVLAGLSGVSTKIVTQGFESSGWTNPNLTFDQCGAVPVGVNALPGTAAGSQCNRTGGNGFTMGVPVFLDDLGSPTTTPGYHVTPSNTLITGDSGTEYGPGTVVNQNFLIDVNPGLTTQRISSALFPSMGRPHYSEGDRTRLASILSMEWLPNDFASFYVDMLYVDADRDINRQSMALIGGNSQLIPTGMRLDANNVVTRADLFNAQFQLEARPYEETLDFYSITPGVRLVFENDRSLDLQFSTSRSEWRREAPTVGIVTRLDGGVIASYHNDGGEAPHVTSNINLNDPGQMVGWNWQGMSIQNEERETETYGARVDFQQGNHINNWKAGLAYDENVRYISAYDGSLSWSAGLNEEIPPNSIRNYLTSGPAGFVAVNYDALFAETEYHALSSAAGLVATTGTNAATSDLIEKTIGLYIEGNHEFVVLDRSLRLNGGVRYVTTDQEVGGLQLVGSAYEWRMADSDYSEVLPAFNAAFDLSGNLVLRAALSRTMTRANPQQLLPVTIFTDQDATRVAMGNVELDPFTSDNFDLGLEWYTGAEGYAAFNYFRKDIDGFSSGASSPVLFSSLNIPLDSLSIRQQDAINHRGGPLVATVQRQEAPVANGSLKLSGVEVQWVQPLPWLLPGAGVAANWMNIDPDAGNSSVYALSTGIAENIANLTTYYENSNLTLRLSYGWHDEYSSSGYGANGVWSAQRVVESRGQWDFSGSYAFANLPSNPKVTFNLINFGGELQRENFQYNNAAYGYYDPGYTAVLGISGTFY